MMAGIAAISGKFGNMYFRTDKKSGRVSLCNLPKAQCTLTEKQKLHHARFAAIAQIVARMKGLNILLYGWKRFRKYGAKYLHALEARDWLYRVEVIDLSEYAGCDLT